MNQQDLANDLRSRINPVYAAQLGTESYERRLCAEAIEELLAENERLRDALETCATTLNQAGFRKQADIAYAALGEK